MGVALLYSINSMQRGTRCLPGHIQVVKACTSFLLAAVLFSCNKKTAVIEIAKPEPRIAKTVPLVFVPDVDPGFTRHQDTVFYKNKFFTGFRYKLSATGDTAFIQSYFNGVEEGTQKKWYPGGRLAEERFYINGKKQGSHKAWWPDGKPKYSFQALDDKYEGEFSSWYPSGLLEKQFHYVNGQEEGSQRLWWDNGTVRANYVIRQGKKYGLIGLKTCINPYDSIVKK